MCYHCSFAITTGKRHLFEYCSPVYLTNDVPDGEQAHRQFYKKEKENVAGSWREAGTDIKGVGARLLPLLNIGMLDFLGENAKLSNYQRIIMKNNPIPKEGLAEKEKLLSEYGKRKISVMALAAIRHPFDSSVPFFRQIYLSKGCFYLANSMNNHYSGTIEFSGSPKALAGLVRRIYEKGRQENPDWVKTAGEFVAGSPHTFSDHMDFRRLLSFHGVIKFGHGYYFVVARVKKDRDVFSFDTDPETLESSVRSALEGKR